MRSLTRILLAAALITGANYTFANAHGTAKVSAASTIQDRHLSGFNQVDVSGSFDVYITQGSTESVKVEAPAEVMDHIITEVEGGELKIYNKHDWNWHSWWGGNNKKIAIYVTAKDLNSIGITGSGDVYFKEGIHTNSLKIRLTGSGDVLGKVDVNTLECSISGSGDVKLNGRASTSSVGLSGSGDYNARDLVTANTTVHVSGSGDASVNASSGVVASVSGSGDVHYTGGAEHIIKSKSGSGDIERD